MEELWLPGTGLKAWNVTVEVMHRKMMEWMLLEGSSDGIISEKHSSIACPVSKPRIWITENSGQTLEELHALEKHKAEIDVKSFLSSFDAENRGFTALHHCLSPYNREAMVRMARLLLERGANPNIKNRFGNVPLIHTVHLSNMELVKLFLEYQADPSIPNRDGLTPRQMATTNSEIHYLLVEALKKLLKKQRQAARLEGKFRTCRVCRSHTGCKRCSGCYLVWYCGLNCQRTDWGQHQNECEKWRANYMSVILESCPPPIMVINSRAEPRFLTVGCTPTKKNFVVKVQIPARGNSDKCVLTVNNKDLTIRGQALPEKNAAFARIVAKTIKEVGMHGAKGFFYAVWDQRGGLRVNPHVTLPVDSW